MLYRLNKTQHVPISVDEAWEFLSNPNNLSELTPPKMNFMVRSGADAKMYAGKIITYSVTPFAGIKSKWVSEITHYVPKTYFIDVQLYGPYAFWHHQHIVKPTENGVIMEDIIHYKVPFGFLGRWLHPILVKPQLEKIFQYRQDKIKQRFG